MVKRFILLSCLVLSALALRAERIMVIADPHVIASSLLTDGSAKDEMLASGRKMLDLSEPAFRALIDTALAYQPELVLIPGDLTKDGELVSHQLVANQLTVLKNAGIPTLVIPGNHDIESKNAYAYMGENKVPVATITDAQFDSLYAAFMPAGTAMHDANSHSYVAEPFNGITLIAIDATHADEGIGSLSNETLSWVLAQADSAYNKGNMIIAMCHWQLIDHFDKQSAVVPSSQLSNAYSVAEQLAQHHIHLVLTGHFHINGITTAYFTSGDSIVEITTGSPVAYPCPYRWLTIDEQQRSVTVSTENIMALAAHPDLQSYSREWQRAHTQTMVPQMAIRIWSIIDQYLNALKSDPIYGTFATLIANVFPKTNEQRLDLVDRHLKSSIVDLYMLHSDANEHLNPHKDSIVNAFYDNVDSMMTEVLTNGYIPDNLQPTIISATQEMMGVPVTSISEDITSSDEQPVYENRTDDLFPTLRIHRKARQSIENITATEDHTPHYDVLGRPVAQPAHGQLIISPGRKILKTENSLCE